MKEELSASTSNPGLDGWIYDRWPKLHKQKYTHARRSQPVLTYCGFTNECHVLYLEEWGDGVEDYRWEESPDDERSYNILCWQPLPKAPYGKYYETNGEWVDQYDV